MSIYRRIEQAVNQWEKQSTVPATDLVLGVKEYKGLQEELIDSGFAPLDNLAYNGLNVRLLMVESYIGISTQLLDKEERQALN